MALFQYNKYGARSAEREEYDRLRRAARRKKTPPVRCDRAERFDAPLERGLTREQVVRRFEQSLFNETRQKFSKSYASIFVENICTSFNLLCVLAAIALVYSHAPISQFLFVAIFALNLGFGIVTEVIAKFKIDRLSILTAPMAQVLRDGRMAEIPANDIVLDDVVLLALGDQIPADCIVAEGSVEVNEALLTGESAPVRKKEGDMLYAGSFISSGKCKARCEKVGRDTYLHALSAKAKKYKKPNSELMNSTKLIIRFIGFLIIPIAVCMFFVNWQNYTPPAVDAFDAVDLGDTARLYDTIQRTVSIVIGMIPSGMLLLTSLALTMGIIRLMSRNTLVQDLYSLEMLARVNVLCLDKTGTLTDGRMKVVDCITLENTTGYTVEELVGSCLNALRDNNQTAIALYNRFGHDSALRASAKLPFSSARKLSAASFPEVGTVAMGAPEYVLKKLPVKLRRMVAQSTAKGLRVLLVARSEGHIEGETLPDGFEPIALITLADNIREEAADTIRWFRENDVAVKVISGDDPRTVSEVAKRVGVEDAENYISLEGLNDKEVASVANKYTVFGRVTPEQKAILVRAIKSFGRTVAMTGDGVNDILAMKEADCAVSVASGSEAAKNVSHIVLMDNNFASMPNVVFEGRRVINNIQKSSSMYLMKTLFTTLFAIISAVTMQLYPFKTNNLMLLEIFVIGVPTFFLSLQPNKNRVKGKFLPYVLSRAVPCAITLVLAVQSTQLVNFFFPGHFGGHMEEISVYIITFAGLTMLYRISQPLNLYRTVLLLAMCACCIVGLNVFPAFFLGEGFQALDFTSALYVMVVVLLCFPLTDLTTLAYDKWQENKPRRDGLFETMMERRRK